MSVNVRANGSRPEIDAGRAADGLRRPHRVRGDDRVGRDVAGAAEVFAQCGAQEFFVDQSDHTAIIASSARCARTRIGFVDEHLVLQRFERAQDLRQRRALHVRAEIARPHELDVGKLGGDVVAHRAFGEHHDALVLMVAHEVDHRGGRAGEVDGGEHVGRAFGMRDHDDAVVAFAQLLDVDRAEALVHFAVAVPRDDLDGGVRCDVAREKRIGQHDHARHAERFDDLHGVGRRAADIGFRLDRGARVHVRHDRHAGIFFAQRAHVGGGDRFGERTAGARIGHDDRAMRVEDLRGLAHEVHAAHHDDVGVDAACFARELQRIADDVGHAVEDLRRLVVVREDHGVAFAFEAIDRIDVRCEEIPLGGGDDARHAVVEGVRAFRDRGGEGQKIDHGAGFREGATLILILRKRR